MDSPRDGRSAIPLAAIATIQRGTMGYRYKGIPMLKNPFDFALYPLLIWNTRPRTILEIGSYCGGSAVWFGDQLDTFGIDGHVYSVDIKKIEGIAHPRVTFLHADGRDLEQSLTPEFREKLPRPWLVIEDADHFYETTKHVLDFFHPHLQIGEYIVIEDGIVADMGETQVYRGGPFLAIQEFLAQHADEYEIDSAYCDFYGHNFTWNTNGFLKKIGESDELRISKGAST